MRKLFIVQAQKGGGLVSNTIYHFNNAKSNNLSLKLLYVSKAKYEADWHSTMHMHPFTEVFYVVNGDGLFKIRDESFSVKTHDLVIVNANLLHTESSKGSNPLEYIVLGIDGMSLKPLENTDLFSEHLYSIQNCRKDREEISFYLNSILREAEAKKEHYETVCQNLVEILVLSLARGIKPNIVLSADTSTNRDGAYIKKYIDIHYSQDLNLDTLAEATYMNKYYLSHVFKRSFGTSPIDYLIQKRITTAKFLLETTKYSIGEISELVGYNSTSYFSQIFKKRTGSTPRDYRRAVTAKTIALI